MRYKFEDIAINSIAKRKPTNEDMKTYIGLEHLDTNDLRVTRFGSKVPIKGEKLLMTKGDILFGRRNTYLKRAAIAPHDGLFSAHGMILRPKEEVIAKEFFPFFISSDYFLNEAIRISVGSISPTVNWGTLKTLKFELPPLSEQRRLSNMFWAFIETRNAYKMLLLLTEQLVKSRFVEMFGEGLKEDAVELNDVCQIITDGTHQPPKFTKSGIPFLFVSNIVDNEISFKTGTFISREDYEVLIKRTPIEPNDIIITTVGSYGNPAIVRSKQEFCFQRHIAYMKPMQSIINSIYLHAALLSNALKNQIESKVKGIAQKTLNLSELKTIRLNLPPLPLQNSFAEFVRQADKSKFAALRLTKVTTLLYNSINGGYNVLRIRS